MNNFLVLEVILLPLLLLLLLLCPNTTALGDRHLLSTTASLVRDTNGNPLKLGRTYLITDSISPHFEKLSNRPTIFCADVAGPRDAVYSRILPEKIEFVGECGSVKVGAVQEECTHSPTWTVVKGPVRTAAGSTSREDGYRLIRVVHNVVGDRRDMESGSFYKLQYCRTTRTSIGTKIRKCEDRSPYGETDVNFEFLEPGEIFQLLDITDELD